MNQAGHDQVEQELQRLRPAAAPGEVMERLLVARPAQRPAAPQPHRQSNQFWALLLRWLIPASAVLIVLVVVWPMPLSLTPQTPHQDTANATPAVKADDVEIQQELVKSFDTIAVLPSGEPVRFRCREWLDEVTLRDKRSGFMIEQRTPRVEVIPVRFETY
jgi:hypothetical protein